MGIAPFDARILDQATRLSKETRMALSFATDIRALFRDGDIECMSAAGVRLNDFDWMSVPANAQEVLHAVSSGSMPPDEPWPKERVALLLQWINAGYPP
jgi:hypothetical protein